MNEPLSAQDRLLAEYFPEADARAAAEARVESGEPLAYVLGEWYFFNEVYTVTPDVLIPRPDTEILVEEAVKYIPKNSRFLDLCTGSGCVAISVLANRTDLTAVAADISPAALQIARHNAERNGVADRISFVRFDVLSDDPRTLGCDFSAVCANPPYINSDVIDTLSVQVRREPRIALDGGADGMDFYRAVLRGFVPVLQKNGFFLFEIGYDQAQKIRALCADRPCHIRNDYGGNPRVAHITL